MSGHKNGGLHQILYQLNQRDLFRLATREAAKHSAIPPDDQMRAWAHITRLNSPEYNAIDKAISLLWLGAHGYSKKGAVNADEA